MVNKQLFLKQLRIQLRGLPEKEIEEIIHEYASYFTEAAESGLSEKEAARNLGHPFKIAQDIKASRKHAFSSSASGSSQARSIIVMIGLIFFNLIFVLGPALGITGAFFGIIFSCIVLIISPFLAFINLLVQNGHLFQVFFSIVLCGLGILAFPYLVKLAKKGQELLHRYIQWNVRMVRGDVS